MLSAGDRVRCVWSGKAGQVLAVALPVARLPGDTRPGAAGGSPAGVLVQLDPFIPRWAGAPTPTEAGRSLAGLEVIYDAGDLTIEPPGSRH